MKAIQSDTKIIFVITVRYTVLNLNLQSPSARPRPAQHLYYFKSKYIYHYI